MPPILPGDVRRPRPVGGDAHMSDRERLPHLNPAEPETLDETAVWASVQIAEILGVDPLDTRRFTYDFWRGRRRRRPPEMPGAAGYVERETSEGATVEAGSFATEEPSLHISARAAKASGYYDRGLLIHEMTHVYMGQSGRAYVNDNASWLQEGMADYVKDMAGYGYPRRGDPLRGYQQGARFLYWVEGHYPTSVAGMAQAMMAGANPLDAFEEQTGISFDAMMADYRRFPYVPHATGPMAPFLRPTQRAWNRYGRSVFDKYNVTFEDVPDWKLG